MGWANSVVTVDPNTVYDNVAPTFSVDVTIDSSHDLITCDINSNVGVALTIDSTPPAQITTAQAGVAVTVTASDAVAGSSVAGAAAGANLNLEAGDAKRLTSGNAAGGNVVQTPGAGIGTGAHGVSQVTDVAATAAINMQTGTYGALAGGVIGINGAAGWMRMRNASNAHFIWEQQLTSGAFQWARINAGDGQHNLGPSLAFFYNGPCYGGSSWGWYIGSNSAYAVGIDNGIIRGQAGAFRITDGSTGGGCIEYKQRATLPTPSTDTALVGSLDNGGAQLFAVNENNSQEQLTGFCKQLASDATNNTDTMSNLTDQSVNFLAGKKYVGRAKFVVSTDQAAEGAKFDFDGGSATMTTFEAAITGNVQGATVGVSVSSALATDLTLTALNGTGKHHVIVDFELVCNAAGTFIPRMSQVAHATGTLTVHKCSSIELRSAA